MCADDPERGVRGRALRDEPGDERSAAEDEPAPAARVPGVRFRQLPEACLFQPLGRIGHGVVRRRTGRQKGHQIVGVSAVEAGGRAHVVHLNDGRVRHGRTAADSRNAGAAGRVVHVPAAFQPGGRSNRRCSCLRSPRRMRGSISGVVAERCARLLRPAQKIQASPGGASGSMGAPGCWEQPEAPRGRDSSRATMNARWRSSAIRTNSSAGEEKPRWKRRSSTVRRWSRRACRVYGGRARDSPAGAVPRRAGRRRPRGRPGRAARGGAGRCRSDSGPSRRAPRGRGPRWGARSSRCSSWRGRARRRSGRRCRGRRRQPRTPRGGRRRTAPADGRRGCPGQPAAP